MKQDQRAPFVTALAGARERAYVAGEFVGQESFMLASHILELARRAGIDRNTPVLDLCCGVAGPGRHIVQHFGCPYLGVDYSQSALEIADERGRQAGLNCRFATARIPPLPAEDGRFEVVVLLETLLAFEEKPALLREIARVLAAGGRLAITLEEGQPLTEGERQALPDSDTVWLTPLDSMREMLRDCGFSLVWTQDYSREHKEQVFKLLEAFEAEAKAIEAQVGRQALADLIGAHRLWADWLTSGRVRKFALVASV